MKPLCLDLFAGLFGWSGAFYSEGYRCIAVDIADMHGAFGLPRPREIDFLQQDVLTLHGSQFKDAAVIVASPPCQAYSYMAMPWTRAKAMARWYRDPEAATERIAQLTALFDACFRIQREANEATTNGPECLYCKGFHESTGCSFCNGTRMYIPMVVENVKGAQPWVGSARWHYGSFFLWGDVPALMPTTMQLKRPGRNFHAFENGLGSSPSFNGGEHETRGTKNYGGSWFNVGSPGQKVTNCNPVHEGTKTIGHVNKRDGHTHTRHLTNQRESDAVKVSSDWFGSYAEQKAAGTISPGRLHGKNSAARKAASAAIAKIPPALATWIARVYKP